jgi:flagellar biogenesis protein FliO
MVDSTFLVFGVLSIILLLLLMVYIIVRLVVKAAARSYFEEKIRIIKSHLIKEDDKNGKSI